MDGRRLPGLTDSLEWDLAHRESYQAVELGNGTYRPIEPITKIITGSHVVMVGVKARGILLHWKTGGWASQNLSTIPSSTTEFVAFVKTESKWLALSQLNLCVFPKLMDTWALRVDIPRWLKDVTVEVWRYDGVDIAEGDSSTSLNTTMLVGAAGVQLLAANDNRKSAIISNQGTDTLYINLGEAVTAGVFVAFIQPQFSYEIPSGWMGSVWGISAIDVAVLVKELV